jgi:hypothetical protein
MADGLENRVGRCVRGLRRIHEASSHQGLLGNTAVALVTEGKEIGAQIRSSPFDVSVDNLYCDGLLGPLVNPGVGYLNG